VRHRFSSSAYSKLSANLSDIRMLFSYVKGWRVCTLDSVAVLFVSVGAVAVVIARAVAVAVAVLIVWGGAARMLTACAGLPEF